MAEHSTGVLVDGPLAGRVIPIYSPQQMVIDMEKKQVLGKYLMVGLCTVEGHNHVIPCLKYFDRQELVQLEEAQRRKG